MQEFLQWLPQDARKYKDHELEDKRAEFLTMKEAEATT